MSRRSPHRPKNEGHNWLRIDLLEGGRYVGIPLTAVN
jgi:hypothetical protein